MERLENPLVISTRRFRVESEGWFFLTSQMKKGREAVQKQKLSPSGPVVRRSVFAYGLGGNDGPNSKTVLTITTQPTTSSHSPWRIMAFRGMQPVP